MTKKLICILMLMFLITAPSINVVSNEGNTDTHTIIVSTIDQYLSIQETLTITGETSETYGNMKFWIPTNAQNVKILFNTVEIQATAVGNEYTCDISNLNITMDETLQVVISYRLSKDVTEIEKTVLRNTTSLSVVFDEKVLYTADDLTSGTSFSVSKPAAEGGLDFYMIIFVIFLIIVILVLLFLLSRKQKTKKVKETSTESKELLDTKKTLLMSVLKDIEKKHRSEEISSDTYHKLKEIYKHQAVETMRKLEDLK